MNAKDAKVLFWGGGRRHGWKREVLMIAGAAGAATALGAWRGGKKGAMIGGISGGVTRLVMRMFGK